MRTVYRFTFSPPVETIRHRVSVLSHRCAPLPRLRRISVPRSPFGHRERRLRLHTVTKDASRAMLKLEWGDAKVWMDTAAALYRQVISNPNGFPHKRSGYPDVNQLNVAAVCAGYAFELIFKVLVRACGKQPPGEHKPERVLRSYR